MPSTNLVHVIVPEIQDVWLSGADHVVSIVMRALEKAEATNIDGVIALEDVFAALAARIVHKLNCVPFANPIAFIDRVVNRVELFQTVSRLEDDSAVKTAAANYVGQSAAINSLDAVHSALSVLRLPILLRHERFDAKEQIKPLCSERAVIAEFQRLTNPSCTLQALEWGDGTQHSIAVIIWDGEMVGAYIYDTYPQHAGLSKLHPDRVTHLASAAHQLCRDLALRYGVFQVDMRMSSRGPCLVDLHPRVPDEQLCVQTKQTYGIDLLQVACQIACGIRPILPKRFASYIQY